MSDILANCANVTLPSSGAPSPKRILVLGSGNFGSCLADHLATSECNISVTLWSRDGDTVNSFNTVHKNPKYLVNHVFPESIKAVGPEMPGKDLIDSMDMLLFAIPTQGLRKFLCNVRETLDPAKLPLLAFVNKGIEAKTKALTLEIIADTCGPDVARVATFISGPSFAKEIIKRQPTTVSVVSLSEKHALQVAELFHQPWFRCYPGTDPIGVELAGALKNVYAIAAGVADGLGYENNTRAGIITRALAEMTRIGNAYGAQPLTFLSLAGVGDLFLTCSSPTSRNYTVGFRLGKGETLDSIIKNLGSVAEGVATTEGLHDMLQELHVYAPIAEAVYALLYGGKSAEETADWLMKQPPAAREVDLPERKGADGLLEKLGISASEFAG